MKKNKLRIIVDTNLWISFLISKRIDRLQKLFNHSKIVLLFSEELLNELVEVSQKPKLQTFLTKEKILEFIQIIRMNSELVEVFSKNQYCRDKNDDFLINLALDGKADYLISGDKDILTLEDFPQTKILTFSAFELEVLHN